LGVEEIDLPRGQRRTHWKQSVPIASWIHALGVARFTAHHAGRVKDVPLQTWVFPQDRDTGLCFEDLSRRTPAFFIDHADIKKALNGLIYQKGGWVLHMLRAEVGTETFWTAIREYYRRHQNQNASTADLRAVFEQVSGKNLDWFFAQWLTRPGVPRLEGTWRYDAVKETG